MGLDRETLRAVKKLATSCAIHCFIRSCIDIE